MRTPPRAWKALAAAVPLALTVAGCTGSGAGSAGTTTAGTGPAVVVGATLSLTGSLDAAGAPVAAGYRQEIANVNAAGGVVIGGRKEKLKLVVLDNRSDPGTASSQASELVRKDHAVALLGYATPQIVTPTALTAEQLRVPFLTSMLPVETFAAGDKDGWKYSWDLSYDEQQQAAAAARALASAAAQGGGPGDKKVALFTDSEPASVVERPLYEAAFKNAGLDLVGDYTFPAGTTDFSSFVADARRAGAQLVAGQLTPADGVALWKQLAAAGFHPRAAFLADAADTGTWRRSLGSLAQGTLTDGGWSPGQASPGQLAAITPTLGKAYAGSPGYAAAAVAYAVAEVLTDALAKSASASPARLNAAIARTDAPTTAGPVRFSQSTHTATTPYPVAQWQDGTLVPVTPLGHGTAARPVQALRA